MSKELKSEDTGCPGRFRTLATMPKLLYLKLWLIPQRVPLLGTPIPQHKPTFRMCLWIFNSKNIKIWFHPKPKIFLFKISIALKLQYIKSWLVPNMVPLLNTPIPQQNPLLGIVYGFLIFKKLNFWFHPKPKVFSS